MTSYLETVPEDVQQQIAFLSGSSSILRPPGDIFNLLLTSRILYSRLSPSACPELYARLFTTKFDLSAALRRFYATSRSLTTSRLAAEFIQRCSVLRRIRLRQSSSENSSADLWTVFLMLLESDGLNELQLFAVGFPSYISELTRARLREGALCTRRPLKTELNALMLWLYWLTMSEDSMQKESLEQQDELLELLRPIAVSELKFPAIGAPYLLSESPPSGEGIFDLHSTGPIIPRCRGCEVTHYSQKLILSPPNLSSVSILVTFALKEARTLQIPSHLPLNRAAADASQRSGPTMNDYFAMAHRKTPLFAKPYFCLDGLGNACAKGSMLQSKMHDQDFYRMVLDSPMAPSLHTYLPGTLTGLWEGSYMVSPSTSASPGRALSTALPDFQSRRPLQFLLHEYLCFIPNVPLPSGIGYGVSDDDASATFNIDAYQCDEVERGLEFYRAASLPKFRYETYDQTFSSRTTSRDPCQALDVIITGETQREHELAWGAFRMKGHVRLRDGLIIIKREPKNSDEGLGTWIFEGHLHAGPAFVGRWRSNKGTDRIEGIFTLRKGE